MRVIHSRKKTFDQDYAFKSEFTLLTWILSIIKWKEYGFTTVLYTDDETLSKIKEYGFDSLYDEIDTEYLNKNSDNIDFWCFWAMPKILSYKAEIEKGYTDSIVADTDVIPVSNLTNLFANKSYDLIVWSNQEYLEYTQIYPKIEELSLPDNYTLPKWFTGNARPLNTGILYFQDPNRALGYLNEVIKIARFNKNHKHNTNTQTMCNAEQRMLAEYAKHYHLVYNVVQPLGESLFNSNALHTHTYKSYNDYKLQDFNLTFLKQIKDLSVSTYNKLQNTLLFAKTASYINSNKDFNIPQELQKYNW